MKSILLLIANIFSIYYLLASVVNAAELHISVKNTQQHPVENAVVYVNEELSTLSTATSLIDQLDKEFIPYVTVIQKGTSINFPNNDNIRHQVYSFSKAKQFEIPLYSGNSKEPITFDKAGSIAMACNIHDWMSAYIYVVNTNKFVITNKDGKAILPDLPSGEHEILVWHPKLKGNVLDTVKKITVDDAVHTMAFTVTQKPTLKSWRAPRSNKRRGY